MAERPFFGGAITGVIPHGFIDASELRQIPDNHEVFLNPQTDACIIIELLAITPDVRNEDLAMYHFQELAKENAAAFEVVQCNVLPDDHMPRLPGANEAFKQVINGVQKVAKFKETAENTVNIHLAVVRLGAPHDTEILLSFSAPSHIAEGSSSKGLQPMGGNKELCEQIFKQLLCSFDIREYGLFQG
jgi:hypothetical protein|mmetsp:Transcript_3046/g.4784  ORF Transcript_3046/g.4784 Transcript_3046/m.4784 type:complete len:188 (+) Transcript_3046:64-627(+)|eukprot:CAMPEP_0174288520 /NCGR_PEP_ID=MMETSP0809-20121228/21089_1 /TAXON_ID=73025 ORGANISM="Eutreptiella gymnastica-like, Strain CCMP1594" /NCGR_SAMPLE_ID=MMETSP0809 /ASSEMBLY_ACC=CAM_ASM_000658 /LENGTH=187 /DNA_ID=CAMNT_0015385795 /DNA_START=15 /DNA_END=578 /DNA_ORIENTATION=+